MKKLNKLALMIALLVFGVAITSNVNAQDDLPPNAQPGKCYAKCMIPDEYVTETQEIRVKDASYRIEITPAVYKTATEEMMVKEAYDVLTVVPPTYTTVTEETLVKEASTRLEYVPATFGTEEQTILVSPASTKWVKGVAEECQSENPDDCKVWCLTEVAAQYRTVTKQVLKSPATTREIPVPAQFKTVTRTVVQTPATTSVTTVPAEYRTVTRQVVDTPAGTTQVEVPAQFKTVTTTRLDKVGGFTEWREVLCKTKLTSATIIAIQKSLKAKGYDVGPIDDILGPQTKAAIQAFQKDNGLPVGVSRGNVPIETLRALGVGY